MPQTAVVTSLQNERVKFIRSLEMRKVRRETGLFVAEGAAILISAREHGHAPETLVARAGYEAEPVSRGLVAWARAAGADVLEVAPAVLEKLASKDNPQSLLGVFRQRWAEPPGQDVVPPDATWLALEEIRDPGNLGTIVRTVEGVGGAGILLVGTCCDPTSREAIRAGMGSSFAVPVARATLPEFLALAAAWPGDVVGTHLDAETDFREVRYRQPTLLVMGSEGPGLSAEATAACRKLVRIPMTGALDSLNLSVATALALYQVRGAHLRIGGRS